MPWGVAGLLAQAVNDAALGEVVGRMKRLRIFPEMCASTVCLFGSSTWNIVPASTFVILPSTSIACS